MLKKMEIIKLPKDVQDAVISKFEQEMRLLQLELLKVTQAMNNQKKFLYRDMKIDTLYRKRIYKN